VTLYFVVEVGETEGLEEVEVKPEGKLIQEYLSPVTAVSPIKSEEPEQTKVFEITFTVGIALTVMVTESVAEHPFESVSVSLYFVVVVGETEGFEDGVEKPKGELTQE